MTSRERVLLTLQHKQPDKVPIDFGGMRSTGIMAIAYANLKKYLGLKEGEVRVYDIGQQLADIEKYFLDLFEVDVIDMMNSFVGIEPGEWKEWMLKDGSRAAILKNNYPEKVGNEWYLKDSTGRSFARMPENSLYFDSINPQLETITSKKDIDDFNWYYFTDEDLKLWEKKAKYLYENTDYAIMGGFGGNMLEGPQEVRGWMNFMADLAGDENYVDDLLDKFVEVYLKNLEMYLQATGKYIQIIQMGDDLGTQRGPLISADLYREKIKPRHKKMYSYIRENSDVCVFLHSCGSIYKLIPDLIDAGVQALNPIQTNTAEMDPKTLKKEFGDKLTFWGGGCETQLVLMNGSPEEVEQQVKERMKIFSPGGGYVFCQVHNIQAGISPENIMALFNAAKKYRKY
jgi:uroporphyrinogen decarboxylase